MPASPKKAAIRTVVIVVSAIELAILAVVFMRRPVADPGKTLHGWWTDREVARPNVLLITLDTTRADHIGAYGHQAARTPNLDGLARRGVLFAQAATPVPLTLPSHSSIMTGLYPTYHGVRLNGGTALGDEQTTLAEAFSKQGYQTAGFIGAFVLDGRWGLNQGFDRYDDQFDMKKFKRLDLAAVQRPANEVLDSALGWLDEHKAGPFFTWIHLYDAHSPYEPPEPLYSEFRSGGLAELYDGEIAFADQQIGRCISWLEQAGLNDNTLVVIVGDHGESLGSHGEGTHGFFIYDSTLHVPFIVTTPFKPLSGVRVESQVSLVDVFPTVLALAGFEPGGKLHGRSLLQLMLHPEPKDKAYANTAAFAYGESMAPNLQYGWGALHSLRSPRYKFIQAPRPELYDLAADPHEAANVIEQHRAVARDMADVLERLMADTSRDAPAPESANLDKETIARLAALGYVGRPTAPRTPSGSSAPLADPKDKLGAFAAVQHAGELMGKDDYAGAVHDLASALQAEPGMPQALLMLGSCYSELGRTKEAKAQFDLVLKSDPESVQGLVGLANILLQEGQTDDVIALALRTLSLDSDNTQAYTLLGDAYIDRRQPGKALPYLEKAVAIQPKLTQNRLNLAACLIDMKALPRAESLLVEIVKVTPRFPGAQFNLGVLYDEQGRIDQARAAYAAEIANYPESFKARFNLGKSLARLGDWSGSNREMREVIRVAPRRPEGYLFLARGLFRESAPLDEIQGLAEKGLSLAEAPDLKALGWFLMADVFNRRHQPDKVDAALRNARMFERRGARHEAERN